MRPRRNQSVFFPVANSEPAKMKGLADDIPARRQIFSDAEIAEYDAQAERNAHELLMNHSKNSKFHKDNSTESEEPISIIRKTP